MTRTRTTALLEQELADWAKKNQELRQENERLKSQIVVLSSELAFEQKQAEERGARIGWQGCVDTFENDENEIQNFDEWWRRRNADGK